ncbi:MAG: hypothetical protein ACI9SG_002561 [Maribacter sp.]|jgi:hypothetical protein
MFCRRGRPTALSVLIGKKRKDRCENKFFGIDCSVLENGKFDGAYNK